MSPTIDAFNSWLSFVCQEIGITPETLTPPVTRRAPTMCPVCQITMAGGDQKNVNRHVLSDTHIRNVARYLHVDPIILKPATLTCPWCAQTLSGDRKDSLKRHEETACSKNPARAQKASRSYTTHDIPDKVSRQVPIRRAHSLPVASSFQTDQHVHTHSQQPFYNNGQAWASPVTMFHPEPLNPADFM